LSENNTDTLPNGWSFAFLGEIAEINPSTTVHIEEESTQVNFVPMRAVSPEGGGLTDPEIRPYGEVKRGFTSFISGDVIMAKITPCMENGKTTVVPELPGSICFGSTEFHVLRAETGIRASWISHFLLRHDLRRSAQRQMTGGVGQMRVPSAFLRAISIPVPPTMEQERITDVLEELLSDLDAGVKALDRAEGKLEQYRASVLKAAVQGYLTAAWRQQHSEVNSGSELLERILVERRQLWEREQLQKFQVSKKHPPTNWKARYKEPVAPDTRGLPELPENWCWSSAEQICTFITKGTTPSGSDAPSQSGEVPFIKVQHLSSDGSFHFDKTPSFVSAIIHNKFLARSRVLPGDVLMNIVGPPLGQVSVVPLDFPESNMNQAIAVFRGLSGVSNRYLATCLSTHSILVNALRKAKATAGQVNLTLEICRELPIPLPPFEEQGLIVKIIDSHLSTIDQLAKELTNKAAGTRTLKQAILKYAFAGQLLKQDPSDEPADILLKRIAAELEKRKSSSKKKPRPARKQKRQQK